ncbi:MAG: DnaJ domain [Verrucomicrobiota bacterium]|jgi:curved DNA-binding protein CbpA
MIDYFALLDQPRKPWLDLDALKEKYHALARQNQPDEKLNEAYRVLSDPKLRLEHLLKAEPVANQNVPDHLVDLFMEIAPVLNKIDKNDAALVDELFARVTQRYDETLDALRAADAHWPQNRAEIQLIHRQLVYLTRWRDLLQEHGLQLSI